MGAKHTKKCKDSGTLDHVRDHVLPDGGHTDSPRASNCENRQNEEADVPEWNCVITTDVVWGRKSDGHEWVNSYVLLEVRGFALL